MKDGDLLRSEILLDPRSDELALGIVSAVEAHDGGPSLLRGLVGHGGIAGGRAHHEHVGFGIDLRGRDRRSRAGVAVDELDAVGDDAVCDRHRLLGIAGIVIDGDLHVLAVHAACLVNGLRGELGTMLELLADAGHRSGHRAGDRNGDVFRSGETHRGQQGQDGQLTGVPSVHDLPPMPLQVRKRSIWNREISLAGVLPRARSANTSPITLANLKPWPEQGEARMTRGSTGDRSITKSSSGVRV